MNQDQVKTKLLQLREPSQDFSVIFSGKSSKKANGVYYPEKREIIIHNKNFNNDNSLMYTAIHEFAHHLHQLDSALPISNRSHTTKFWSIFHKLLFQAEELDVYHSIFETNEEFLVLTHKIKSQYLTQNGQLIREFGKVLLEAQSLCAQYKVNFMDYLDRVLRIPRESARSIMKTHLYEIEPELGYENMKTLVGIADPETRKKAQEALLEGYTPAMVKERFKTRQQAEEEIEVLQAEKSSLENRIQRLTERLDMVEKRLRDAEFQSATHS